MHSISSCLIISVLICPYNGRNHPRGCGAHCLFYRFVVAVMGSSPRVRGSQSGAEPDVAVRGIIPAGAGLTALCDVKKARARDHPRGCGAHDSSSLRKELGEGSSPRVRGSLAGSQGKNAFAGIIPAGAGLTSWQGTWFCCHGDHPRGCGAHGEEVSALCGVKGSSPRVRGSQPDYWLESR